MRKHHGMSNTPIYRKWKDIKRRCLNPNRKSYKDYGGRGISMYPEWLEDFSAFYDYVSKLDHYYEEGYSLDRIDNNGNYEPGNLRWIKIGMQVRNRRNSIYVDYNGVNMLFIDAAKISGINYCTLKDRYRRGDRGDILFRPVKKILPKSDLVLIDNDQALTTSLIVAEKFEKRHDIVLRDIRNLIEQVRSLLKFEDTPLFYESTYTNEQNKQTYPMYLMNRDGFLLLAMGFTGTKALEFKLNFIAEFNRMQTALAKTTNSKKS